MYLPANLTPSAPACMMKRERYEMEEAQQEARQEAMQADFDSWTRMTYCDRSRESGKREIETRMNVALDLVFDNDQTAEKFRHALFCFYCSNDHAVALREFIGPFLLKAYAMEWATD
jgi:hypothetical protein